MVKGKGVSMILGIFAGVGSGKSLVLEILKKYNFAVIEADKLAHDIYLNKAEVLEKLVNKFGSDILDENSNLNKKKLAEKIFINKEYRKYINNLIHPLVWNIIEEKINSAKMNKINLAIEAAIIPNSNIYDYKVFVDTDDNLRFDRLKKSRGYSDEKIKNIIKAQADKDEYKKYCDFIIYNNFSKEELEKEIFLLLEKIKNANV